MTEIQEKTKSSSAIENPQALASSESSENFEKIYSMIFNRNKFYNKNLRFLLMIYLLGILGLIFLLITVRSITVNQKSTWYVPTNLDGTIIRKEVLQEPISDNIIIPDQYVIDWVQDNIPVIYDFDFLNMTASYRSMIGLFTPEGFTAYAYALETQSKTLKTLEAKQLVLQGYGCGSDTVKITFKGVQPVQGYPVYTWILEMPIVARYTSYAEASAIRARLVVNVQRVPRLISKNGLAIYGFIVNEPQQYKGDASKEMLCQALVKNQN